MSGNFRKILQFTKPFRRRLILAIGLAVLLNLIGQIPPWITRFFIDHVIEGKEWHLLLGIVLAQASVPLLSYAFSFWDNFLITYVGQKLVFNIRNQVYRHLMRLPMDYYHHMGTGKIISRLMGDTATVQSMVTWNTISIVNNAISFFIGIGVIFYFNWKLALVTFMILPLHWLNYKFFVKRIRIKSLVIRRKWDHIYNLLHERISGTKLVRTFNKEEFEGEQFVTSTEDVLGSSMQSTALSLSFGGVSGLIDGIGNTIIFFLGCYFVIRGEMTYGTVAAFMAYVWRVLWPIMQFTSMSNQIEQTMVSVDRIFEVLDVEPEKEGPEAIELPPIQGHVRFEQVWFEYKPGEPVIKDFTLDVPAGTTVALVGHTGCGKTTVTSLLLRFYDLRSGRILVDGYDISKVRLSFLRRQIGQVLQESTLFYDATVRENIGYGLPHPPDEQIVQAAKISEIQEFIETKPKAYDELIGGKGLKLSVGEKQRMCIARAVMTDPRILILDEATSALDTQSEALIQKALERVLENRTSFVIAHRLSTILNADLIVVMDQGEIVEMGTHKELVQKENGHYRNLYEQQFASVKEQARWEAVSC